MSHPATVLLGDPRAVARPLVEPAVQPANRRSGHQPTLPLHTTDEPRILAVSRIRPEDRAAISALTQALVETLQGRRPLAQLDRWVVPDVSALLGHLQRAGRQTTIAFRSARIQIVSASVAEVSLLLNVDGQHRAVALRLVRVHSGRHWVCTRFEAALWSTVVTKVGSRQSAAA
jgi:hypothetical protein